MEINVPLELATEEFSLVEKHGITNGLNATNPAILEIGAEFYVM